MAPITEGDKLPEVELDMGFPPKKVNMLEHSKGKKSGKATKATKRGHAGAGVRMYSRNTEEEISFLK